MNAIIHWIARDRLPVAQTGRTMRAAGSMVMLAALLGVCGCMNTRTQGMVERCQSLLEAGDATASKVFIEEAEEHIASSGRSPPRWQRILADLQDEGAEDARPALEQCLWLLKYRQPSQR